MVIDSGNLAIVTAARAPAGSTSSRVAQRTGIPVGIGIATTGGMGIVAALSTALGSSSTSDFIPGGRTAIHMVTVIRIVILTIITLPTIRTILPMDMIRVDMIRV